MTRPAPVDLRPVDRGHADAATADHDNRFSRSDLGRIYHRAISGDDAATDQRCEIQRHVLADFDDRILMHQHLLGERRQIQELVQLLRARP